jgi:hypothetical protein
MGIYYDSGIRLKKRQACPPKKILFVDIMPFL